MRRPFTHLVVTCLAASTLTGCEDATPPSAIVRPTTTPVAGVRDTSDTTTPPPEGPPQVVVDTTPPVITYTLSGGTLGQNGWYVTEPVKIEFSITDLESPVRVDDCPPVELSTPGWTTARNGILCSTTSAGGTSTVDVDVYIDAVPPRVRESFISTAQSAPGWFNTDVSARWACWEPDYESGVVESSSTRTLSAEGVNQELVATCRDKAGNIARDQVSGSINIDKTPPTLAPTVSPNPVLLNGTATVSPNASDALAGVGSAGCRPAETSSVGRKSVGCFALDGAGNETSRLVEYIVAWPFTGFVGLNAAPALNPAKTGGSIQVKFSLGGNRGLAILAAGSPTSQAMSCGAATAAVKSLKAPAVAASDLSYNDRTDTYSYDWTTDKSWAGTCRQLTVKLVDGTERTLNFQFAK